MLSMKPASQLDMVLAFALPKVNAPADVDEEHWQWVTDVIGKVLDQCCRKHQQSQASYRRPTVPSGSGWMMS